MRKMIVMTGALLLITSAFDAAAAEGDPKRGALVYRACVACHSLVPGLHLTGPSLADVWGQKAASVAGFPRYSNALKDQDFAWDETTLNAWLADPKAFVKGNYMTFRGIGDDRARADLIAFLRLAFIRDGAKSVVAKGLITEQFARGQAPEPLRQAAPSEQVTALRHCHNSYFVVTADGIERLFWEQNLRLKIDSGPTGPKGDRPVLVASGMQGDRASLIFSAPSQLSELLRSKC